jgi:CP family cyanate transporter-like MFS transporter
MTSERSDASRVLLLVAVVLVGLNLRPFLTGIGPLAAEIQTATGLGFGSLSLFTLVPMLLMGVCAFAGPWLQRVLGARMAVVGALCILCTAAALRLVTTSGEALIATAAFCGLGVAVVQAVFPGIVKAEFPGRVALVMGLYSAMLMGGGALGAQLSPLIAERSGSWHVGLGWIALPAAMAALVSAVALPSGRAGQGGDFPALALLRRPRTWLLMICFGLVNGGYASVVAWLAPAYQAMGWSGAQSGGLLAVMAASQAVAALGIPALAARNPDRRFWIWLALACQVVGFAGLAWWPLAAPTAWAVAIGIGLGAGFALFLIVALDHIDNPANAGALSALMQGGGFLISAIPPWIVALLRDAGGSFTAGWLMHLACAVLAGLMALRFAPRGYARAMRLMPKADQALSPR